MTLTELAKLTYAAFRPPKKQTASEWADENRVLVSEGSAEPGRWRTDRAPYQRRVMDAFSQPGIWRIVFMASAQVGKSEAELNMMGSAIDNDPGPMLYVQPTDKVAEDYSKRRIAPMIAACPTLHNKVYKAKGRDAANTITMKTFPGGSLAIIGANSPSDLASKPVRYIFLDEIDRFPASAGTEGDPIDLAERRTETFRHNRKIVLTSTPTIKNHSKIEAAYLEGTQEEWRVECPQCHEYSFVKFPDIRFTKEEYDAGGKKDYRVLDVHWRCPECGCEVGEHALKRQPAKWVALNPEAEETGILSFKINAFLSPWSDWKDICHMFLKAKDDPEKLKVFTNTILAESWEMRDRSGRPEAMFARREHYNAEVPSGVLLLTMGIDTQDNRLEYEVVGWNREEESWGIQKGVIPGRPDAPGVWEEVDHLLDREWKMKNGMRLRIMATFVDSGGHFTDDVYRECDKRAGRNVYAIKGEGGENKPYVRMMKRDKTARGKRGGVRFIIGVDSGKEAILYACGLDKAGPRYMHYPIDYRCGYDAEYFRGLISEQMVIHRRNGQNVIAWEKVYDRNEPLDIRNYNRAVYRYFKWDFDRLEAALSGITISADKPITKQEAQRKKQKYVVSNGITV